MTTLGRLAALGFLLGGSWALGSSGCERDVDDHCANLSGDASCKGYSKTWGEKRDFCSSCESAYHGCVEEPPTPASCWAKGPDPSEPPVDDTGTADGSATGMIDPSTGTGSDDVPVVTGDASGSDGSGTGAPQPVCGDGIIEGDEVCDGENLGGQDCSMFGGSGGSGTSGGSGDPGALSCNDDCTLNPIRCDGFSDCGDNSIEGSEECDGTNLGGHTCATQERVAIEGTLQCSNCLFNTTDCCIPDGEPCATDSDCCMDSMCSALVPPLTAKTCKAPT